VIPVTIQVGDVLTIKARAHTTPENIPTFGHITIPKQHLVKLLRSGKVTVHHDYTYTDDYAWDAAVNFQTGDISPEGYLADLESWGYAHVRCYYRPAWIDIHGRERPASIHCYRHTNEGYTILPRTGEITVSTREGKP
jgi:hypothetical protein